MRLVAWNCAMAFHRKVDAISRLKPDIAVISECAHPDILAQKCIDPSPTWLTNTPIWIGKNKHKGLGVFAWGEYSLQLADNYASNLHYIAPVHVRGKIDFNLLGVWAQNANAGIRRKNQPGPMRRALTRYRDFLHDKPGVIAGDLNNNIFWDKPDWKMNHATQVEMLEKRNIISAYHHIMGENQGSETISTHYWRDRKKDGPTYHIDYIFMPQQWKNKLARFQIGTFEDWCGNGLSDHAPLILDIDDQ